jgi:hypothetical protein
VLLSFCPRVPTESNRCHQLTSRRTAAAFYLQGDAGVAGDVARDDVGVGDVFVDRCRESTSL